MKSLRQNNDKNALYECCLYERQGAVYIFGQILAEILFIANDCRNPIAPMHTFYPVSDTYVGYSCWVSL